MPSASKHNKGTVSVRDKFSDITDHVHAATYTTESCTKHADSPKDGSRMNNVDDLDEFMEGKTDQWGA